MPFLMTPYWHSFCHRLMSANLRCCEVSLVRYRLLFWMTVAGACDRAEQEVAGMENRISGAMHVIIDRIADV
jgi:hypothetical protein